MNSQNLSSQDEDKKCTQRHGPVVILRVHVFSVPVSNDIPLPPIKKKKMRIKNLLVVFSNGRWCCWNHTRKAKLKLIFIIQENWLRIRLNKPKNEFRGSKTLRKWPYHNWKVAKKWTSKFNRKSTVSLDFGTI